MNRRQSPASLATVLDDHLHWLGRWQCSLLFPDKVPETNPHAPDTLLRWLSSEDQQDMLEQPVVRRLQDLHDEIHDQAYQLGGVSPRSRPPFEEYEEMLRNFDSFVAQLRRVERLIQSAAKAGGLAALNAGKTMGHVLHELAEIMARVEAKGLVSSLAVASIDNYDALLKTMGSGATDFIAAEVAGRIGHNLRPFDDVFRLEEAFSIWYLQQAKLEDAVKAADRVRRKVSVLPVELPDGRSEFVTLSVSLVSVDYAAPPAELINLALDALRISQANAADQIVTV
jgi:GGDEF domain-containing protein